jgi:hypothetical protein
VRIVVDHKNPTVWRFGHGERPLIKVNARVAPELEQTEHSGQTGRNLLERSRGGELLLREQSLGARSLHSSRYGPEPGDIEIFAEWYDIQALAGRRWVRSLKGVLKSSGFESFRPSVEGLQTLAVEFNFVCKHKRYFLRNPCDLII